MKPKLVNPQPAPAAARLWPADAVERRPVAALVPYARNARTHSPAQVDQIAGSIREWGWTVPVLVDEAGGIIAGHGRVLAAHKLGIAEVPAMVARGWTETQKRAYVLADNKLALNAGWDNDMLAMELGDLHGEGVDLGALGFGDEELSALLGTNPNGEGLTDPDDVPAERERAVSVLGDVWLLGKHRLVCGDCTDADAVAKALNGVTPHLMVTDPPYGVNYEADWRNKALRADGSPIAGRAVGAVLNDGRSDWREAWTLFPGDVAYVWQGDRQLAGMARQLADAGFETRNLIVWAKSNFAIGRGHYHPQHETCWYAVRKSATAHWVGDRKQTTLWQIPKPAKSDTGHSTQKPVECMKRPMENNSSPGQAVYEPFAGSFTTGIAAEITGRACHAIELNPLYVDLGCRRWQDFTGRKAILEATGQTFEDVEEERLGRG